MGTGLGEGGWGAKVQPQTRSAAKTSRRSLNSAPAEGKEIVIDLLWMVTVEQIMM